MIREQSTPEHNDGPIDVVVHVVDINLLLLMLLSLLGVFLTACQFWAGVCQEYQNNTEKLFGGGKVIGQGGETDADRNNRLLNGPDH